MFRASIVALPFALFSWSAVADHLPCPNLDISKCSTVEQMLHDIEACYHERPSYMGRTSKSTQLIITVQPAEGVGRFTIIEVEEDESACAFRDGIGFKAVPWKGAMR